MSDNINKLRVEIDKLDDEIINLLNQRYNLTDEIGCIKRDEAINNVHDQGREEFIYDKIEAKSNNHESIKSVYKTILEESKKRQ